jgi:hypothetical protein
MKKSNSKRRKIINFGKAVCSGVIMASFMYMAVISTAMRGKNYEKRYPIDF